MMFKIFFSRFLLVSNLIAVKKTLFVCLFLIYWGLFIGLEFGPSQCFVCTWKERVFCSCGAVSSVNQGELANSVGPTFYLLIFHPPVLSVIKTVKCRLLNCPIPVETSSLLSCSPVSFVSCIVTLLYQAHTHLDHCVLLMNWSLYHETRLAPKSPSIPVCPRQLHFDYCFHGGFVHLFAFILCVSIFKLEFW